MNKNIGVLVIAGIVIYLLMQGGCFDSSSSGSLIADGGSVDSDVVQESDYVSSNVGLCSDTDRGDDPGSLGTCSVSGFKATYTDVCGRGVLIEYYCARSSCESKQYICSDDDCRAGVCSTYR